MAARHETEALVNNDSQFYGTAEPTQEHLFRSPSHDADLQRVKPHVLRRKLIERQAFSAVFCICVSAGVLTASFLANSLIVFVYGAHFVSSVAAYLIALVGLCTADSNNFSFFFSVRAQRRTTLAHIVALLLQLTVAICVIALAVQRNVLRIRHTDESSMLVRKQLLLEVAVVGAVITCIKTYVLDRALIDNVDGGVDDVAIDSAGMERDDRSNGLSAEPSGRGRVELDWGTLRALRAGLFRVISEDSAWCGVVGVAAVAFFGFPLELADDIAALAVSGVSAVLAVPLLYENMHFLFSSLSAYYLPRERVHLALMRVPGVAAVTSADVYGVSAKACAVACHIEAAPNTDPVELARDVDAALYADLNVVAATVQVDPARNVGFELSFGYDAPRGR